MTRSRPHWRRGIVSLLFSTSLVLRCWCWRPEAKATTTKYFPAHKKNTHTHTRPGMSVLIMQYRRRFQSRLCCFIHFEVPVGNVVAKLFGPCKQRHHANIYWKKNKIFVTLQPEQSIAPWVDIVLFRNAVFVLFFFLHCELIEECLLSAEAGEEAAE